MATRTVSVRVQAEDQYSKEMDNYAQKMERIAGVTRSAEAATRSFSSASGGLTARLDAARLERRASILSQNVGGGGDIRGALGGAVAQVGGVAGANRGQSRLGRAGRALFQAPSVPIGPTTTDQIGRLLTGLGRLNIGLKDIPGVALKAAQALGPAGIGLGAAIIAITVLAVLGAKKIGGFKKDMAGVIDAQGEYFTLIQDGTEKSIAAAIEAKQAELDAAQATLAARQAAREATEGFIADAGRFAAGAPLLGDAAAFLSDDLAVTIAALEASSDALEDSESSVTILTAELDNLTRASESAEVAANTLAEAEAAFAEARAARADEISGTQLDALIRGSEMSAAAIRDRAESIQNEIRITEQFIASGATSQAQTEELRLRINELGVEFSTLTMSVLPATQALEDQIAAQQAAVAALEDAAAASIRFASLSRSATTESVSDRLAALGDERDATAQLIKDLKPLAETSQFAAERLALAQQQMAALGNEVDQLGRIMGQAAGRGIGVLKGAIVGLQGEITTLAGELVAGLADIRSTAIADFNQAMIDLERDAALSRLDADADAQDRRIDAVKNFQKRVEQIEKNGFNARARAVGERDALAFFSAEQAEEEQLEAAEDAFQEQQEKLDAALEKQLASIERNLQRRIEDEERARDREILLNNQRLRERINMEQQAIRQEIQLKITEIRTLNQLALDARQQQVAIETSKQTDLLTIAAQGSQVVLNTAASFWQSMVNLAAQAAQQAAGQTPATPTLQASLAAQAAVNEVNAIIGAVF